MSEWFEKLKSKTRVIELNDNTYWKVKKDAPKTEKCLNAFTNLLKKKGKSVKPNKIFVSFDGYYLGVYFIYKDLKEFDWTEHIYELVWMMLKKKAIFRNIKISEGEIVAFFAMKNAEDVYINDGSIYYIKEDDFKSYLSTFRDLNGL